MPADLLILKKRGERYEVKVTDRMKNRFAPNHFNMNVNLKNYKDLALFFSNLKALLDAPVDKAIEEYKSIENQRRTNPFW